MATNRKPSRLDRAPDLSDVTDAPAPEGKNRRGAIVAALRRCMLTKGYAETSLTDLANAADMSVSHLLYYYPSKDAVLLDLSDQVNARIWTDVTAFGDEPPEERIHVLVDNVFVRGAFEKSELGLVRELMALSTHRPELQAKLQAYSGKMMGYLEDLFSKVPRQPGLSALDAAEVAGATWIGLVTNSDYDERLNHSRARRLFRRTLLLLANLDPASPQPGGGGAPPRRKGRNKTTSPAA
jgi:AcrR family transcriptional regulator